MEKMVRTQGVIPRARADPGSRILIYLLRCGSCSASCTQRKALTLLEGFPSHGSSPWSLPSSLQEQQEQGLPAQRGSGRIPAAPKSLSWSTRVARQGPGPSRAESRAEGGTWNWECWEGRAAASWLCLSPFCCSPPWFIWNPRQAQPRQSVGAERSCAGPATGLGHIWSCSHCRQQCGQ